MCFVGWVERSETQQFVTHYAHDEPGAYAAGENYFPDGMTPPRLYEPTERGLEAKIKARLDELRALDARARNRK